MSLVNTNTVDWFVPSSAYATGIELPNVVTIGADASGNQVVDVRGQTLTPYSYTFFTTNVAPYIVSSSIDNQVFSPAPANVTDVVTFSQPMNTSFTTAAAFGLLGNHSNVHYAAASFSWDPTGTILTINYDNLPADTYTLTLYASGFKNLVGLSLASNYVANFTVGNVAPYIVSSSIDNQVFSPAPANVSEVVTFSQPMNTTFTTTAAFGLLGNHSNVHYAAASFSWDPTSTILTINYDNLPADTYTLTLYASGFKNVAGQSLAGNYVTNFTVTNHASPPLSSPPPASTPHNSNFSVALTPVKPLGSLVYQNTTSQMITGPGYSDTFTVSIAPNSTLAAIVHPTSGLFQPTLTLFAPSGRSLGSISAAAKGQNAVIPLMQSSGGGV